MNHPVNKRAASNDTLPLRLFRKSLPQRVKLQEIIRLLGPTAGQNCLELTRDDGVTSYTLRQRGGNWRTLVLSDTHRDRVQALVGENVDVFQPDQARLPFDDKEFDAIVVVDFIECVEKDLKLVEELHRLLKPTGRLVVNMSNAKRWTLLRLLQQLLGVSPADLGQVRPSYSESQAFRLLRDGFDVHEIRTYSRFFLELVDTFVQVAVKRERRLIPPDPRRVLRIYSTAYPFYWLAFQILDLLVFFTKGYNMVLVAKRHLWRPRTAPVLTDGRSITEAVLRRAED